MSEITAMEKKSNGKKRQPENWAPESGKLGNEKKGR